MSDATDDISLSLSQQVPVNSTFHLRCPARAVPTPQITWYKNGLEIDDDASERIQCVRLRSFDAFIVSLLYVVMSITSSCNCLLDTVFTYRSVLVLVNTVVVIIRPIIID